MRVRKITLSVLLIMFVTPVAFCQSEVLKGVINSLARYQENKDLKHLGAAKKSIDSLIAINNDTTNFNKNLYLVVINSSILYIDSLNSLNYPPDLLSKTSLLLDKLHTSRRKSEFKNELSFAANCLANVHVRNAFNHLVKSDVINAQQEFLNAKKYSPTSKHIDAYLAYANVRLGNLAVAAGFYDNLLASESLSSDHLETASAVYKAVGDTVKAIKLLQLSRKMSLNNNFLLLDEANIYNNKRDYASLEPLLPDLLDNNANNPDIVFIAANCYDRLGKYDKAESLYFKATELNSAAFEPAFNLGLLYFKKSATNDRREGKNLTSAARWLEKANEIEPGNINTLQLLSMLYKQSGDKLQLDKVSNKLKQLTN